MTARASGSSNRILELSTDAQPQPQVLGSETVSQQLSQYFRMIAISLSRYQERVDAAGLFEIDLESLERDKDRENARLPRLERKLRQRVRRQDLAANQADGPPDIVAMTVERFRRDARRVFDSQENRILKLNLDLPCQSLTDEGLAPCTGRNGIHVLKPPEARVDAVHVDVARSQPGLLIDQEPASKQHRTNPLEAWLEVTAGGNGAGKGVAEEPVSGDDVVRGPQTLQNEITQAGS